MQNRPPQTAAGAFVSYKSWLKAPSRRNAEPAAADGGRLFR